jgi:hypothetical protein
MLTVMSGEHSKVTKRREWAGAALTVLSPVALLTVLSGIAAEEAGYADVAGLPFEHHTLMEQIYPKVPVVSQYDPSRCSQAKKTIGQNTIFIIDEGEREIDSKTGVSYPSLLTIDLENEQTVRVMRGNPERLYRGNWLGGYIKFDPFTDASGHELGDQPIEVALRLGETVVLEADGTSALELSRQPQGTMKFIEECNYPVEPPLAS